jgi:DNA modification methylase
MKETLIDHIYNDDALQALRTMQDGSVDCIVTSPPYYGLRDYGIDEQIGLEETPQEYIDKLVKVFNECKRVLAGGGYSLGEHRRQLLGERKQRI